MIVVPLLTMMSCGNSATVDDDDVVAEQEQVQIHFTINMAGTTTGTRAATWGDNIDDDTTNDYDALIATYNENAIDPGKFQVLVFDTEGNYLDELDNLSYLRSTSDNGIYDVVGTLSVDKSYVEDYKLSCKLVVLANYDDTKASLTYGTSTLDNLKDLTFSYDKHLTADIASGKACIPMFGVATFTDLPMFAGNRTNAGTVYMLRAMAKIRVNLNLDSNGNGETDTGEEYAITSVSLTNLNQTTGYIMPNGFASVESTTDLTMAENQTLDTTTDKWSDTTFNPYPPSGTSTTDPLALEKESDTEYYLYVPEYVISNGRPKFSIRFDFMTESYDPYTFVFDEYENGRAKGTTTYNIERNHVYTFTITKSKGTFTVETGDWANTFNNEYTF